MTKLSPEAIEYLSWMLAAAVEDHVESGLGGEPMPAEFTELYNLTIGR